MRKQELSRVQNDGKEHEDKIEVLVTADAEQVRQRFGALGDVPAQVDRLRRETATLNIESKAIFDTAAALDPTPGPIDMIRSLPLPDGTTIAKHVHAAELGEQGFEKLSHAILVSDNEIETIETELVGFSRSGKVPSRSDLLDARSQRDTNLDRLRNALDGDPSARAGWFSEVVQSSQAVDRLTDALLTDTQRAALQEDAQRRLALSKSQRERNVEALSRTPSQSQ